MSQTAINLRSKCPVRRLSDLFVQVTNLALNTAHRGVSCHLGLTQQSCRKRCQQTLAPSLQLMRIAPAQPIHFSEKTPSPGLL